MSIELITILFLCCILLLLFLGLPVAFTLGGVSLLFTIVFWSPKAVYIVASSTFATMNNFVLIAAPLFIFMAHILQVSGIADDLYTTMYRWAGPLRGGLAMGTVIICTVFAAMSGISAAGTVTMGKVALPEMLKRKYREDIAIGCILGGGALGILIPPSLILILYGGITGVSVGKLFIGGIIPGVLLAALLVIYIGGICYFKKDIGPSLPPEERVNWKMKLFSLKSVVLPLLIVLGVLGSIYGGIATPTEAAGIGTFGAIISGLIYRKLKWKNFIQAVTESFKLTAMVFLIVVAADCMHAVYGFMGGAKFVNQAMLALPVGNYGVLIGIQLILILMGMFLEPVGITMISIPIFLPVITSLGFDPLWFGILFVVNLEMSYLTPPVGMNLFFIKGVCPTEITMGSIYRAAFPMLIIQAMSLAFLIIFPQLALWLPSFMS